MSLHFNIYSLMSFDSVMFIYSCFVILFCLRNQNAKIFAELRQLNIENLSFITNLYFFFIIAQLGTLLTNFFSFKYCCCSWYFFVLNDFKLIFAFITSTKHNVFYSNRANAKIALSTSHCFMQLY